MACQLFICSEHEVKLTATLEYGRDNTSDCFKMTCKLRNLCNRVDRVRTVEEAILYNLFTTRKIVSVLTRTGRVGEREEERLH